MAPMSQGGRSLKNNIFFVQHLCVLRMVLAERPGLLPQVTKSRISLKLLLKSVDPTWKARWRHSRLGVFQKYCKLM